MPYTVKTTTKWGDSDAPDDQVIDKLKKLFTVDFREGGFDPTPMLALRKQETNDGNLLARGVIMAPDGKSVTVTAVWKSQEVYEAHIASQTTVEYRKAMTEHGFVWSVQATSSRRS